MKPWNEYQNSMPFTDKANFTTVFWYRGGKTVAKKTGAEPVVILEHEQSLELSKCLSEKVLDNVAFSAAAEAYKTETRRLTDIFKQDLFEDLGIEVHPLRDKLFSKAWERGHGYGFAEVYSCAEDLMDLLELPPYTVLITPATVMINNVNHSNLSAIHNIANKLQELLV